MRAFLIFILALALGAFGYWYFSEGRKEGTVQAAQADLKRGAEKAKEAVQDKLSDWSLNSSDIKDELEKTGKVVRQKAKKAGQVVADAAADAKITTTIKGKLALDRELSALRVNVSTTDGVVTMSGTVNSHDLIRKAMEMAKDTEGVTEVVSTLQVKPSP